MSNSDQNSTSLWVRLGTIDGVRYLCRHFQVVVFSKDVKYEDVSGNRQQVETIGAYFHHQDIPIDGIYGRQCKWDRDGDIPGQGAALKPPHRQGEIWEDYKQIYLDFGLKSENSVRDRVLFVNSFDGDFNAKHEEMRLDNQGYFLLDTRVKPARPLVEGLPLTYETKEKGIDLSDSRMFQFKHKNRTMQ